MEQVQFNQDEYRQPAPLDPKEYARRWVVEDAVAQAVPLMERQWYYSLEVEPGVWTKGRNFRNVITTRMALKGTDVEGRSCIDIGSMDGMIPILLARRGARSVLAYDRMRFPEKIAHVKTKLGVAFDYECGESLREFRERHLATRPLADVVVFSGVLYHMFDPLAGLMYARSLVRNGGIMIVETGAVIDKNMVAHFNAEGRLFSSGDNYWLPGVSCLEYMLRFARLEPLDCFYVHQPAVRSELPLCRVCIPCRATETAPGEASDPFIGGRSLNFDWREVIDWSRCVAEAGPDVPYTPAERSMPLARRADGLIDLYPTILTQPEAQAPFNVNGLALADRY